MDKYVSVNEVARVAGVSRYTVAAASGREN